MNSPGITHDRFLDGAVSVVQPVEGYRAGMDAVLLAASLAGRAGESIAEAGCGAGAALVCAAHRLAACSLTGFEREPGALALAQLGIAANGLDQRVTLVAETPLKAWILFLHHITRPGGRITIIHRAAVLGDLLELLGARTGEIEILPVRPAPGVAAGRVLVRARKGLRRGPVTLYDGLTLHHVAGGPGTSRAADALRGGALEWK